MRRAAALVVTLALAAGAAACSGGGSGGPGGAASSPTTEGGQPRRGGVLRVGIDTPASLDPMRATSTSEKVVADLLYDGLTAVGADGRVVPALADRWSPTPDLAHWDFHLRPGARFSNGRAVTAGDVVYSLERAKAGGADLVRDALAAMTGISAPAPDTVRIDLAGPDAELPAVLANPGLGVVARETVDAGALATSPVGTGPFVFGRTGDTTLRFTRAPDAPAYLDAVQLELADPAASYEAFKAGRLDWTVVPSASAEEAAERYGRHGFTPFLAVLFYGINLKNPKFADVRFREAIVRAVDRASIASVVYGGVVRPLDGVLPKGVPGWQASPCPKCAHDLEQAKALVGQVFPAGPPRIGVDFDDDPTQQAVARALQAGLAAAGIPADLRPHPVADYAAFVGRGEQELFRLGWVGVAPAASRFLVPLFRTGSPTNVTGFSVPAVDELLDRLRSTADDGQRVALAQDAERRIMDLVPIVPVAQFETLTVAAGRVRGLALTPMGSFDAARVWLAR